jgi:putative N6-adenine-specific DNA methylase
MKNFEPLLAAELKKLGLQEIQTGVRAVRVKTDEEGLYRILLHSRLALRVHRVLYKFKARDAETFYDEIASYNWAKWINDKQTLAVDSIANSRFFKHSHFVVLKAKDAIVDRVRMQYRRRPSVDVQNPDLRVLVRIQEDEVEVAVDAAGRSLHRRGYRTRGGRAPLNEVLAAGMLNLAGFDGEMPFADLCCGSGTLAIEAALMATRTAPGLIEPDFHALKWKYAQLETWEKLIEEAKGKVRSAPFPIHASDISPGAIRIAKENVLLASMEAEINFQINPFDKVSAIADEGILVLNPPYGQRMDDEEILPLYEQLGSHLKHNWTGWDAWILSSERAALKRIGLKTSSRQELDHGGTPCLFFSYALYRGSKKASKNSDQAV